MPSLCTPTVTGSEVGQPPQQDTRDTCVFSTFGQQNRPRASAPQRKYFLGTLLCARHGARNRYPMASSLGCTGHLLSSKMVPRSTETSFLPEGPLPAQGGGGHAPALPVLLPLHLLLSQRRRDVGGLVAFVREVLVKRHCRLRLAMGSPSCRHIIFLHIRQLPVRQVGFRVASSSWQRQDKGWGSVSG